MKTAIQTRLRQTPEQNENMLLSMWLRWCGEKTDNQVSLQKAMSNRPLFNWWKAQIEKREVEFLEQTQPYAHIIDAKTARVLYADTIIEVFDYFARPLMPKKTNPKPLKNESE